MIALVILIVHLSSVATACSCTDEYATFRAKFGRPFDPMRCEVFCRNSALVRDHNSHPESTYQVELRQFHDLPDAERASLLCLGCYKGDRDRTDDPPYTGYADIGVKTVSWFTQDRVTDVRDQQQCGDCWAESATAVAESVWSVAYGNPTHGDLTQLSVQMMAECPPNERNHGCDGGWPIDALRFAKNISGICTEAGYPTVIGDGIDRNCNLTKVKECAIPINLGTIVAIPPKNETGLYVAAQRDVVSVAIDASGQGFYGFKSGVYNGVYNGSTDCTATALDHAVVVTGIGTYRGDGVDFYTVRNSWGVTYGMQGNIFFKRGENVCGIAQDAVHLVVEP